MKLSEHARNIIETCMKHNKVSDSEREEIEQVIANMPEDRVFLQKNVVSDPLGDLPRYSIHIRVQHLLTFSTFLTLAFTGLPIHFIEAMWAEPFNEVLGGVGVTRIIHRTLAVIMIGSMIYHLLTITMKPLWEIRHRRFDIRRTILPLPKDIRDFREDMLYHANKREQRPEMDKYMYKQKIHYFAAGFGNMVMVLSGSSFLFPEFWASILPVEMVSNFQELMRLSHPHEALLALLVIAFWHWYNVHLAPGRFPMQWTFLTGKITREHQIEEHFLEYLRNLVEIPEERQQLQDVLDSRGLSGDDRFDIAIAQPEGAT